MSFTPDSLLWVKLEGYPWWPCQALSPEQAAGAEIPEGFTSPLPIVYLGSNEMGFIDAADSNSVIAFDPLDGEKCDACSADPTLVQALDVANQLYSGEFGAAAASSDDDDDEEQNADDVLLMGGDDGAALGGETEEERRIRRKKEKKEKKSKKDKKDKKKEKKDKHRSSRDEDDEDAHRSKKKKDSHKADRDREGPRREKRTRIEKGSKYDDADYAHEDDNGDEVAPIRFEKIDVSDDILLQLKANLENALENKEFEGIRDALSDLSKINVTFDQLVGTGIGQAVGLACDLAQFKGVNESFGPLQTWANAIIRFWFSQIPDRHKEQLVDAGEVDRASLASNEDAGSQNGDDEFVQLDKLGLALERSFLNEEVTEASNLSAAEVALSLQLAIEALDATVKVERGAQILKLLQKPDHAEIRLRLLRNELSIKAFLEDPTHVGMTTAEKEQFEAVELEHEKAYDITGEKERIEHAIAEAEVVEK